MEINQAGKTSLEDALKSASLDTFTEYSAVQDSSLDEQEYIISVKIPVTFRKRNFAFTNETPKSVLQKLDGKIALINFETRGSKDYLTGDGEYMQTVVRSPGADSFIALIPVKGENRVLQERVILYSEVVSVITGDDSFSFPLEYKVRK